MLLKRFVEPSGRRPVIATGGTHAYLKEHGVEVGFVRKVCWRAARTSSTR
jgi:hypothetical protein